MSAVKTAAAVNGVEMNRLAPDDRAVHDWYRFILSYPPHLVREYLCRFQADGSHQGFSLYLAAINRKQIPVCRQCHWDIHRVKYDGASLSAISELVSCLKTHNQQ